MFCDGNMSTVINSNDEYTAAIKSGKTIIRLTASWCGPCKRIAPTYEGLAKRFPAISFYTVDVDKVRQVLQSEGATSIPFFSAYCNGIRTETLAGASPDKLLVLIGELQKK